jgi:hypothetical protein
MPIRNQLSAIVQQLVNSPNFAYGSSNELNHLADDLQFPCVFLHPITGIEIAPAVNGSVRNTFIIHLEFLYKTDFDQYTADNELYVTQALKMANEFMVKTLQYASGNHPVFKISSGQKAKCLPVYNKYDVNTTGVSLTLPLQQMEFDRFI